MLYSFKAKAQHPICLLQQLVQPLSRALGRCPTPEQRHTVPANMCEVIAPTQSQAMKPCDRFVLRSNTHAAVELTCGSSLINDHFLFPYQIKDTPDSEPIVRDRA